ncbi:MAG: WYL domain-containing protein [Erysipelotrichaceae bacterium]|nr:WYL domain-containing protein [Erysipelotrichaceae bacterium]
MNKQRILELVRILRKKTDPEHKKAISVLMNELDQKEIHVSNRKTFYDDFRSLDEYGLIVENDNGQYYLSEAPFSLAEIKILIDSLNSLKDLDDRFVDELKEKLYSFISEYEVHDLKQLEYTNDHLKTYFIHRLEDTLQAIRNHKRVMITRKKHQNEEIAPLFLYRENEHYYLYYHYPGSEKIYHLRFDHIDDIKMTENDEDLMISRDRIISLINESTNAYHSSKTQTIRFLILNDSESLRNRLQDDFPNLIFTRNGFSIKASVNEVLFAKLTGYGTDIKISDEDIAYEYTEYLNKIIRNNRNGNSTSES